LQLAGIISFDLNLLFIVASMHEEGNININIMTAHNSEEWVPISEAIFPRPEATLFLLVCPTGTSELCGPPNI
jgi:hypothetical protein